MKLDYQVHTVSRAEAPITVKVGGKDREVRADVVVVELVREGSAITLRLEDVEEAEKLFKKAGQKVSMTLAGAK